MPEPIYVVVQFALMLVKVVSFCMFARAILSWFELNPENKLVRFLYAMTEPAVQPVRNLFYKKNWFADVPIDMSFTATFMIIYLIEIFMEMLLL